MPTDLDPLDLADRRVNDGTADERRLAVALIAANRDAERYRIALESLTPGGSGYHRNPERCVEVIQDAKREPARIVSQLRAEVNRLQAQAQAIELALGAGEHLVDRSGAEPRWRTLPEAVAAVVGEVERLRALQQPGQMWCMVRPGGKVWSHYPSLDAALRAAEILGLGSNAGWHIVCPDGERIDLGPDGRPVKP